jgi:hypothetical protein
MLLIQDMEVDLTFHRQNFFSRPCSGVLEWTVFIICVYQLLTAPHAWEE